MKTYSGSCHCGAIRFRCRPRRVDEPPLDPLSVSLSDVRVHGVPFHEERDRSLPEQAVHRQQREHRRAGGARVFLATRLRLLLEASSVSPSRYLLLRLRIPVFEMSLVSSLGAKACCGGPSSSLPSCLL